MNIFFVLLVSNPLSEGGPFMYIVLLFLVLSLCFLVRAFMLRKSKPIQSGKMLSLTVDCNLLTLVIGCLGSVLGLVQLFDAVESVGNIKQDLLSAGLKISLLTIVFGLFAFVIGRIGILIFRWTTKKESKQ